MTQTVLLSSGIASDFHAANCIDPFQINYKDCPLVSKVHGSVFGYDNERNECREVHNALLCDSKKAALFNTLEECIKCVNNVEDISEVEADIKTCFDNPCNTDLCLTSVYKINCFVPPCPQYQCVKSDDKINTLSSK